MGVQNVKACLRKGGGFCFGWETTAKNEQGETVTTHGRHKVRGKVYHAAQNCFSKKLNALRYRNYVTVEVNVSSGPGAALRFTAVRVHKSDLKALITTHLTGANEKALDKWNSAVNDRASKPNLHQVLETSDGFLLQPMDYADETNMARRIKKALPEDSCEHNTILKTIRELQYKLLYNCARDRKESGNSGYEVALSPQGQNKLEELVLAKLKSENPELAASGSPRRSS